MIDHSAYFSFLKTTPLAELAADLENKTAAYFRDNSHGDLGSWLSVVDSLPDVEPSIIDLSADAVTIGDAGDCDENVRAGLKEKLMQFHPWRKGPFDLFGIHVDTEWRSDLKWVRLTDQACSERAKSHIDLKDKLILDVGCGNGYYMYRMLGAGAKAVVGIDPYLLFAMQFLAVNRYVKTDAVAVLPLKLEDMPDGNGQFDTVFSMGILYHRRDPQEHLEQLRSFLRQGGELVIETIVLDKPGSEVLVPQGRYAKMRNVWNIPTTDLLAEWLENAGFGDVKLIETAKTTAVEQRKTEWMQYESLRDFLDPGDPNLTIEGHPAPVRAVFVARK
jgi:tRNA (mo5U34)-methyltransferase